MEITWLIILALIVAVALSAILLVRTRAENAKLRSEAAATQSGRLNEDGALRASQTELEVVREEATRLKARVDQIESYAYISSFDADRVFKLLAKSNVESVKPHKSQGIVQDDSGKVSPFLIAASVDHLDIGDRFGVVHGQLAKLEPEIIETGAEASSGAAGDSDASKTVIRQAAPPEPVPQKEKEGAQRTVLFRPPPISEPEDSTAGLPYLKLRRDGGEDQLHYLKFGSTWAGRDQANEIVIQDDRASRRHFEIMFTENRFQLRDNDSTNGTTCNDSTIQQTWLEFGDEIKVGNTTMEFSCEGYDCKESDAPKAIAALEKCIQRQPDFIHALKLLAFLLERDVARKSEAAPLWDTIARLEK